MLCISTGPIVSGGQETWYWLLTAYMSEACPTAFPRIVATELPRMQTQHSGSRLDAPVAGRAMLLFSQALNPIGPGRTMQNSKAQQNILGVPGFQATDMLRGPDLRACHTD